MTLHDLSRELNLRCTGAGRGRPVIAIHGALSDHRVYAPLATALGRSRPVFTYDQRYFGTAPWVDDGSGFSRQTHEDDLIALIEELACGPIDLLAWSYGGDVAMHAILRRPDLFHAVVLFDPSVGAVLRHVSGASTANAEFHAALRPAMDLLADGDTVAAARAFLSGVTGRPLEGIAGFGTVVSSMLEDNARTLAPFLKALVTGGDDPIETNAVAALTFPALILTGTGSLTRYRMIAGWLAGHWPDAECRTIADATHFGPWEKAEEVANLAERFFQCAGGPGSGTSTAHLLERQGHHSGRTP